MIPEDFAERWEAAWNTHDLDAIMSHYDEAVVFRSTKALALTGDGEVRGKAALRAYWSAALASQPRLRFRVRDVLRGHDMLVLVYLNHRDVLAAETLYFGADGKVFRAAACHRSSLADAFRVVVRLWVVEGEESGFRHFEDRAIDIMHEHGVRVVSIERPTPPDPHAPYEVHVLEFPARAAFDAYRADVRLAELAELRDRVVLRTEIELPDSEG